jgi:hypothetical protein
MGNKHSHDESDGDDRSHLGTLRDFLKVKSPILSPSGKRNNKEDAGDHPRQASNNSSNLSEKDPVAEKPASLNSPFSESALSSSSSKPDGITKLAKVSEENFFFYCFFYFYLFVNNRLLFFFKGAHDSISASRDKGWDIPLHIFCMALL